MAKIKKTKKKLKLLRIRARMKRIHKIMEAIRVHKSITQNTKKMVNNGKFPHNISNILAGKIFNNKVRSIEGRISSSKKRARDLWTKKN
ncbi:MAG: hypothetical protein ISP24_03545 [Rickettsiales bacterium]|nr:hypothetical protein [Rickettsiales bacterium]